MSSADLFMETVETQTPLKPFCRDYEKVIFFKDDTRLRVLIQPTGLSPESWRILFLDCFEFRDVTTLYKAVHENRFELMAYFDVKSICFRHSFETRKFTDLHDGWVQTKVCLLFGLVPCTFIVAYINDTKSQKCHFVLQTGFSTIENITFDVVSERLKVMIVEHKDFIDEDDDDDEEELIRYYHADEDEKSLYEFRKSFKKEFKIVGFAHQREPFFGSKVLNKFENEDHIFSHNYNTYMESLCFRAKIFLVK